jgi:NADPH:quinone reductase-like Zn-dependent oxidoreductase
MKAIVIDEFGGREKLKLQEVEQPQVKENQVLIEVYATSVNPIDIKRRKGLFGGKTPMIVGGDIAGIVKEVGEQVSDIKVGDRVMANGGKTYAEFAVAKEELTVRLPEHVPFDEAAAVPLAGQTAWQTLLDLGRIKEGDRVLIHAGAGGVGTLAIQIAKAKGAWIAATASGDNQEFLTSLGVNQPINYQEDNLSETVDEIDFVLDTVGGRTQAESFEVLRKGGMLVSIAEEPDEEAAAIRGITATWFSMRPTKEAIQGLNELFERRELKPIVAKEFSFTEEDVQKAHEQSETGHVRGKLVIRVKD